MQALTCCWIFDKRWFCGLRNPFVQLFLIVPIVLNTLTIIGMVSELNLLKIDVGQYLISLVALYSLLILLCSYLLMRSYMLAEEQLKQVGQNYEAIRQFTHHFESKKSIWSVASVVMIGLIMMQMYCNQLYMDIYGTSYRCFTNHIRWWVDIACWSYIGLVILIFLICKLVFLFISWKHPDTYLEYKEVI